MAFLEFFRHGGKVAWGLVGGVLLLAALSVLLLARTAEARYERDVTRMVFNHTLETLEDVKKRVGETSDTLEALMSSNTEAPGDRPYIVVSIEDHRLWYKQGNQTLFTTQVATGSGKVLVREGGNNWKFETPRGRLVVQGKETDPVWVPPDWHFIEQSKKRKVGVVKLNRGQAIPAGDGSVVTVVGNDVVRQFMDGRTEPFEVAEVVRSWSAGT